MDMTAIRVMFSNTVKAKVMTRNNISLEDQTLREAFQVHHNTVPVQMRIELAWLLVQAGFHRIQIGSLVRPDRMPQMAESDEVARALNDLPGLEVWGLVMNQQGLSRAINCGLRHVAVSASLAPLHSMRNLGCNVERGLLRSMSIAHKALECEIDIRMGLQCAFGGPLLIPPRANEIDSVLQPFFKAGVRRFVLADTAARATPAAITNLLTRLRERFPDISMGLHLHGKADQLALNLEAAWQGGVDWLDVSLDGRGGCPFLSAKPPMNLSTQQAVSFLTHKGVKHGIDLERLNQASHLLDRLLNQCAKAPDGKTTQGYEM